MFLIRRATKLIQPRRASNIAMIQPMNNIALPLPKLGFGMWISAGWSTRSATQVADQTSSPVRVACRMSRSIRSPRLPRPLGRRHQLLRVVDANEGIGVQLDLPRRHHLLARCEHGQHRHTLVARLAETEEEPPDGAPLSRCGRLYASCAGCCPGTISAPG